MAELILPPGLTEDQLSELAEVLGMAAERRTFHALDFFRPYPKQAAFFHDGINHVERLLMAGNQNGKTYAGAYETALHLTGLYPEDWGGIRFTHPIKAWACGESGQVVRDAQQAKLCGPPGVDAAFGTGMIPKSCIIGKPTLGRGTPDLFDTIQVQHFNTSGQPDGISTLTFKSYEAGRAKFQATTLDWVWFDEEPPEEIYSEGKTRTIATGGRCILTFTPLKGMSNVVLRFLHPEPGDDSAAYRSVTIMTIDDAEHIPEAERARIIAGFPAHERDARSRGIPMLGSGRIFTAAEANIAEEPLEYVPPMWCKIWGIDFGIDHPFAAALLLWDKDNDIIHLHHAFRISDARPLEHAAMMLPLGANVPVAWPRDGQNRVADNLTHLKDIYAKHKLMMLPSYATWEDGSLSTEAGVLEMQERMATGRFKVNRALMDFWEEYRLYHRKDGLIVKLKDDILSACRIGIMAKRFSRAVALGGQKSSRRNNGMAQGIDFDLFST